MTIDRTKLAALEGVDEADLDGADESAPAAPAPATAAAPGESALARAEREYNAERERARMAGYSMATWEQSNARRAIRSPRGIVIHGHDCASVAARPARPVGL